MTDAMQENIYVGRKFQQAKKSRSGEPERLIG
jgi:hypothetical protein